ncbi:DNA cytosine methyltransferase [bacterium]|nr:DNA cytosine methyltransferase [bacterium]
MCKLKGLSLFANVGIAETYLHECGVDILLANEIDSKRAEFYTHLYKNANMIVGDITMPEIKEKIVTLSKKYKIDFIIATPPCQGMSLAGKMDPFDERNQLISYAIEIIKIIKPKYILLENVPQLLKTKIKIKNKLITIPEYIHLELDSEYNFAKENLISAMDYEVPQMRKRNIFLLSRKDMKYTWQVPPKKKKITLKEAIGNLPSVDPLLKEGLEDTLEVFPDYLKKKEVAQKISKFHHPPIHAKKHAIAMMHTPSGHTAFDNKFYYPKKDNGERVNGHYNTYRRYDWNKPARTITQNNGVISSLCCVHPGRKYTDKNGNVLYSDPRCLTIYELLIVFSLPKNWNIPEWADDLFIRHVIGEGIPPMLVKNLVYELTNNL